MLQEVGCLKAKLFIPRQLKIYLVLLFGVENSPVFADLNPRPPPILLLKATKQPLYSESYQARLK